jgi:hypothetical protein
MTRNVIVMTGLRNKFGHDDRGAGSLVQLPLIVVRS